MQPTDSVSEQAESASVETFGPAGSQSMVLDDFRTDPDNNAERPTFTNSPFSSFSLNHDAPDAQPTSAREDGNDPSLLMTSIDDDVYNWDGSLAAITYVPENDIIDIEDSLGQEDLSSPVAGNTTGRFGSQELFDYNQSGTAEPLRRTFATPSPQSCLNLSSHLSVSARSASVVHLMEHYRDIAETFFSPRRTSKLPWVVMHLPTATSTLAKMTSGERPKFVQTALLNAVLSVSAFNLDKMNVLKDVPSDIWWVLGQSFRSHSKFDMQKHLSMDLTNPDSTQYIETLMALLTMATASVRLAIQTIAKYLLMLRIYRLLEGSSQKCGHFCWMPKHAYAATFGKHQQQTSHTRACSTKSSSSSA
jgi:hypothetical protein